MKIGNHHCLVGSGNLNTQIRAAPSVRGIGADGRRFLFLTLNQFKDMCLGSPFGQSPRSGMAAGFRWGVVSKSRSNPAKSDAAQP